LDSVALKTYEEVDRERAIQFESFDNTVDESLSAHLRLFDTRWCNDDGLVFPQIAERPFYCDRLLVTLRCVRSLCWGQCGPQSGQSIR